LSEYENYPPPKSGKSYWGCCLGGCLGTFIFLVVLFVAGGFGVYYFAKGQVQKYTAEGPRELPKVELPDAKLDELQQRLDTFEESAREAAQPKELVLTAEEINGLIQQNPELAGKVFVTISKGQISAELSFPADAVPGGSGRYFNGSVAVDVSFDDGVLIITPASAEVNGEAVPDTLMEPLRQQNLAKGLYEDVETAEMLRKFKSLIIDDNRIILSPRERE
jgi:hypothetical protein